MITVSDLVPLMLAHGLFVGALVAKRVIGRLLGGA